MGVVVKLLDLFSGAGGCSVGYHRAGFDVTGVDIEPHPDYPYELVVDDAVSVLGDVSWLRTFDAIHASPPCQRYVRSGNVDRERHPDLLPVVRDLLGASGLPYVIENVPGAPMRVDLVLCGSMFGLEVRRHRWFEANWPLSPWTLACDHSKPVTGVYGHPHGRNGAAPGMLPGDLATWSRAMGIDWMTASDLAEAIPPAYTEHIGSQLLTHLEREAVA